MWRRAMRPVGLPSTAPSCRSSRPPAAGRASTGQARGCRNETQWLALRHIHAGVPIRRNWRVHVVERDRDRVTVPDELVNTKAYLLWVENGRPEGADFGRASYEWISEALDSGSSLDELEALISWQREAIDKGKSWEEVSGSMEELNADWAGDEQRVVQFDSDLIAAKAFLLWVEAGRPQGVDFQGAALTWLEEECNSRRRPVMEVEVEVFVQRATQETLDRLEAGGWQAARPKEQTPATASRDPPQLRPELVNTKAYLLWVEHGRPDGADFGQAAYTALINAYDGGRSVAELEEEVFVQKATQDTLDMLEAEGRIAGSEVEARVGQHTTEVVASEADFSIEAVNTRAYLMWIENGRPDGADFGNAAREWLWEALRGGRSVAELEAEVFARRAMQRQADWLEEALERQRGAMQGLRAAVSVGKGEIRAEGEAPQLNAELVNTKAYLLWIENGRPQGADFGSAAYTSLVEAYGSGRTVGELEEETYMLYAMQCRLDELVAAVERLHVADWSAYVEYGQRAEVGSRPELKHRPPRFRRELVTAKAHVMWIEAGRPEGADFGHAAYNALLADHSGGRSVAELEADVFSARHRCAAQDVDGQQKAVTEDVVEAATPPELAAELVNTKAYLLWIENGRPEGADFGHSAYLSLVEDFRGGRSVEELEAEVFQQKAAQDDADREAAARQVEATEKEATGRARLSAELVNTKAYLLWIEAGRPDGADFAEAAYDALTTAYENGRSVEALEVEVYEARKVEEDRERLEAEYRSSEEATRPQLSSELINTKAYLLWIEAGRPEGADFGHAAYTSLLESYADGRSVRELEEEVYGQRAAAEAEDMRERLGDELINTKAYLLWIEAGRPEGADFGGEAFSALAEAVAIGRSVKELKAEVFEQKGALETEEASVPDEEPLSHALELESAHDGDKEKGRLLPSGLVKARAYLLWVEAGRPDGANFDSAAHAVLSEALHAGRSVEELEAEVFMARAKQDKRDAEAGPGRWREVDIGPAFTHWRNRNAMDLMKLPSLGEACREARTLSAFDSLVAEVSQDESVSYFQVFPVNGQGRLLAVAKRCGGVHFVADAAQRLVLHWGVATDEERSEWVKPEADVLPKGSTAVSDGIAAETAFQVFGEEVELQRLELHFPRGSGVLGVHAVLRSEDSQHWWKDGQKNYVMWVPREGEDLQAAIDAASPFAEQFADDKVGRAIAEAENEEMWTLMHRYNKAAELLEGMGTGQYGEASHVAASLFVWLRFSANRHITWQRNYNTQPRILSAAQDRLTQTIAKAYSSSEGEAQEWVRSMIGLLGRGGDGQRIRDEILNIMHRNNIKEVKGSWVEEWHQKLHNNTTPDDVGICEAYIAFLRGGGDAGAYWHVLDGHGITRERLQSFDRPINAEPEDFPWMRDALIGEFEHYLGILKAVHSGTDLHTCAGAADWCTPHEAKGHLDYVLWNLHGQALPLIEAAVEARAEIASTLLQHGNRELLYLDLALEGAVRMAAERVAGAPPGAAIQLLGPLLQNLALTVGDNAELCFCLAEWNALPRHLRTGEYPTKDEALRVAAVADRIRNELGVISDRITRRVEPISRELGAAFGVAEWAVKLFAEEVVRGTAAFAVSQVLTPVEHMLRVAAESGAWQVVSPGRSAGRVVLAKELHPIQHKIYDESTILIVDALSGEEEIPQGVTAVLTRSAPDILSHVSVRARNMGCLLASCYDDDTFKGLRDSGISVMAVETSPTGDILCEAAEESLLRSMDEGGKQVGGSGAGLFGCLSSHFGFNSPTWCGKYAVGMDGFHDGVVGAKSKGIAALRGRLPHWVHIPEAVTVPFGSFEQCLEGHDQSATRRDIEAAIQEVLGGCGREAESLSHCRELVQGMPVPEQLKGELVAEMERAGLRWPGGQAAVELGMQALKGVWASKFNDRAYYSLRKAGLPFRDVRMAVLVMHVVPADYAFVIHTTNPITRDAGEVYCELVKGLGETLVSGQFPGRSLSFSARKDALGSPTVLSYPSKSEAMYVADSLIFRSDSNAEDLDGYAGAGLYDSITMHQCQVRRVNYAEDRIMTDEAFRNELLSKICEVGHCIEEALGGAQDIEGVVDAAGQITIVQARPQV